MTREERQDLRDKLAADAKSKNTILAYGHAWSKFSRWCEAEGVEAVKATPDNIADFITDCVGDGYARSTIRGRVWGIRWHLKQENVDPDPTRSPAVEAVIEGAVRNTGETRGAARPMREAELRMLLRYRPKGRLIASKWRQIKRGKTALRCMYDSALRVSEAAALDFSDIKWPTPDPITGEVHDDAPGKIFIRRAKSDQLSRGVWRTVRPATINSLALWAVGRPGYDPHTDTPPATGSVFGVGAACLGTDIRRLGRAVGLDGFSSHSARIGAIQDAFIVHRWDLEQIRVFSRHKSLSMVRHYLKSWLTELDPLAGTMDDPLADLHR